MRFTRIAQIVSAPVRVPVRLVQQGTNTVIEKGLHTVMKLLLLAALRNGLKLLGLAGVLSESQANEYVGALMLVGGLTWTLIKEWRAHRAAKDAA